MSRVLILNENPLERENMREILSKGLPKPEVAAASSTRQALELLGEGGRRCLSRTCPGSTWSTAT